MDEVVTPASTAAPAHARTDVLIWFAILASVFAGATVIAAADQPPNESAHTTAETYLAPDGDARVVEYADGARWIVESAHSTGLLFPLQQPLLAGDHQLQVATAAGRDVTQTRYWRQTWTDAAGERGQLTELYELDDDGVRLLTLTGGTNGFSYSPGVLILPRDVAPGSTWSSSGDALPQNLLTYESTGSAKAGDDGCLVVESSMRYFDPAQGGAVVQSSTETETWCPGAGRSGAQFETDGTPGSATVTAFENGEAGETTLTHPLDFSDSADWSTTDLAVVVPDPLFGESTYTTTTDGTSATTPSGLIVFNTGVDVSAYRLTSDRLERQWLARPGGGILWLSTVGEVTLVATTDRLVVAYDSGGRRAWRLELDDVLGAAPVGDNEGGVLLQVLDGDLLRVSASGGEVLWQTALGDDSDVAPAVSDGVVFAADRGNSIRAFSLSSGQPLWSAEATEVGRIGASRGTVFAATFFGYLGAWDAATGALLWQGTTDGVPSALEVTDTLVAVQSSVSTKVWSHEGDLQFTVPGTGGLMSDGTLLLVAGDGIATLYDPDGAATGQWAVEQSSLGTVRRIVAAPSGFFVVGSDFRVQRIGAR